MAQIATIEWKDGARMRIAAATAKAELDKIKRAQSGKIHAEDVVRAARPAKSPLHAAFEWDDSEAAEQYRLTQAREVMRSIVVRYVNAPADAPPTRLYVNVDRGTADSAYMEIAVALGQPEFKDQILERALREAQEYQRRYQDILELSLIFRAIVVTVRAHAPTKTKPTNRPRSPVMP